MRLANTSLQALGGLLLCGILLAGCQGLREQENLYTALGGEEGIRVITENFIRQIANDERVIDHFEYSNVQRFREKMHEHLCLVAEGPCAYSGDSMIDTHTGMGITEGDFNAIVEDMMAALDEAGIPISTQNRLLARLAEFRGEILYR
ncbi:MAG: group 1 truncated hemoglobin [Pseudomonadota bacterium]